jgi:hypothetical protein
MSGILATEELEESEPSRALDKPEGGAPVETGLANRSWRAIAAAAVALAAVIIAVGLGVWNGKLADELRSSQARRSANVDRVARASQKVHSARSHVEFVQSSLNDANDALAAARDEASPRSLETLARDTQRANTRSRALDSKRRSLTAKKASARARIWWR